MFTGIIAAVGKVESIQNTQGDMRIQINTQTLDLADVKLGDSIANNGVCLTVVDINGTSLCFDVSKESLQRTSLKQITQGSEINLEKALAVGERLGGHFVSGHVDGLGKVISLTSSARSVQFRFEAPQSLMRYIAEKGSICIDGVSLTVNNVGENWFEVNIIPHTMEETIIKNYKTGSEVNLEVDLIARYLESLMADSKSSGISKETLLKHGFM
jgi:riboflavin synthase